MFQDRLEFVVAGVQKAGTCTLDAILRHHPQIQMASVKEAHFFDDEKRDWRTPDYGDLHALFPRGDGRLRGDATPITSYWSPAAPRLREYNPEIRIVLLLRDPIARAFSHWRLEHSRGWEVMPFSEAIRGGRDRVRSARSGLHRTFSYVERGFYGEQLVTLSKNFPRESIHCEIFEEFHLDRAAGLERIARFLHIESFPTDIPNYHLHRAKEMPHPSVLADEDAAYLSDVFRDQIAMTEAHIRRSIPRWRRVR